MTLREIVDNSLEDRYIIEEGFAASPAVFYYVFSKPIGSLKVTAEKTKAKLGLKSGKGENATVYKLTPEQKSFLKELKHKYGSQIESLIKDFRVEVAAPFQILRRANLDYGASTSLTRYGMSKDEYLRAYESGKNKILRMGNKENAFFNNKSELDKAKKAYEELEKKYTSFSNGTNVEINSEILEKLLSLKKLGKEEIDWPIADLEAAYNSMKKYQEMLNNPKYDEDGKEVFYDYSGGKRDKKTRQDLIGYIEDIRKFGYRRTRLQQRTKDKEVAQNKNLVSRWETSFNKYLLRKDVIKDFEKNFSRSDYISVYKNVLESEMKAAEAKLKEARNSFINVVPRHTLNEKEAKIWKLKPTGKASSGNLDDWYLAIKAEDFGTKKVKKPRAIERAEFELSKKVSAFNSKLSKILDEEEMQKLKDLRLIDNLITVKIQKEDNNDFEKDVVSRDKEKGEDQQEKKDDTKRNTDE